MIRVENNFNKSILLCINAPIECKQKKKQSLCQGSVEIKEKQYN